MSGASRSSDPTTSREASDSVNVTALERIVLNALREHDDGATSEELAAWLALPLVSVSPRLRPLATKGLIIDSGLKRMAQSGRRQIVWRIRRALTQ